VLIEYDYVVAVLIQSFAASAGASGVRLEWDIAADEVIRGFNIYRKKAAEAAFQRINSVRLIDPAERVYLDATALPGRIYDYLLAVVTEDGSEIQSDLATVHTGTPLLSLHQNHPNPFNPGTIISFTLPEPAAVNLSVYSLEGKLIKTLADRSFPAGYREIHWDGTDHRGNPVGSGVYLYRLKAGKEMLSRKMVVLK